MSRIIRNVNVLDLSTAGEESLEGVSAIENVNLLISNKDLRSTLAKISLRNINQTIEGIKDVKIVNGKSEIRMTTALPSEPANLMINGKVTVYPDVTEEALTAQVGMLFVNGKILCPKRLEGIIRSKIQTLNGKLEAYTDDATTLVQNATFDETFVRLLKPGSKLAVVGGAQLATPLDPELLKEKIGLVEFVGDVVIRAQVFDAIADRIQNPENARFTIIPAQAVYLPDDITLDKSALARFTEAVVYVNGDVRFAADVSSKDIENSLSQLLTTGTVHCRADLRDTVSRLCDIDTKIVELRGRFLEIDGEHHLASSELRFSEAEGGLTISVNGWLKIADDVDPELLLSTVHYVDNSGVIDGTEDQCAAIRMRLRTNHGMVQVSGLDAAGADDEDKPEDHPDVQYTETLNYLKL